MSDAVFVYDDDCGFCTWWADKFADRAGLPVVGYAEIGSDLRERLPDDYTECSHLVTDERVYSCGASVEEALLRTGLGSSARPLADRLERVDAFRSVREGAYRAVADRRGLWGRLLSKAPPVRE